MKLTLLNSSCNQRGEWVLVDGGRYLIGRQELQEKAPDVDLAFDRLISPRHCLIFSDGGKWWIEDLHSKDGIRIRHSGDLSVCRTQAVMNGETARLMPGDEILVGGTTLVLEPHHRQRAWYGALVVEADLAPSINYSLIHCGLPVLVRLAVRNYGQERSTPVKLSVQLLGHGLPNDFIIPAVEPEGQYVLNSPELVLETGDFESLSERKLGQVLLAINDTPVLEIPIWLLAHNEWSQERNHRLTLASFVQPNHPLIKQIELETRGILNELTSGTYDSFEILLESGRSDRVETTLRAFYQYFQKRWHLHYYPQPPCYESNSQKLRMPHHVLLDFSDRRGEGTCIDLAVLFAACLEYLGLRPLLILMMGETHWHHALVGCRAESGVASNPIMTRKERLDDAMLLDPTGFAEGRNNLSLCGEVDFDESRRQADDCLGKNRFLYALDIAAARLDPWKVTPLPAVGEPVMDPDCRAILAKAAEHARMLSSKHLGTLHLLWSLAAQPDGLIGRLLDILRIGQDRMKDVLTQEIGLSRKGESPAPQPTPHYDQIIALAKILAKRDQSPLVQEAHLITALLETQGDVIDKVLEELGTRRAVMKKAFAEMYLERNERPPQGLYYEGGRPK